LQFKFQNEEILKEHYPLSNNE